MPTDESKYIKVDEIQQDLEVCRMTVYRMINRGQIPSSRIGRIIKIRRGVYEAWKKENHL